MQGGDFFDAIIKKKERRLDLETTKFYAIELLLAIECLHENLIMHRDIKPENILLDSEGHIKLCDFNFCKIFTSSVLRTKTFAGSPNYAAPEVVMQEDEYDRTILIGGPMDVFYMLCFSGNIHFE